MTEIDFLLYGKACRQRPLGLVLNPISVRGYSQKPGGN